MQPVKRLSPADTIGMIAPSGPAHHPEDVAKGIAAIEDLGFRVVAGESCYAKWGYLAGSDRLRAADIQTFFEKPDIDGIFCMKGGDGAPRLLDRLDYARIARHPKVFLGYSDITALHLALARHCGFMTFHGPMPVSEFIRPGFNPEERTALMNAIGSRGPLGTIGLGGNGPQLETLSPGVARGRLTGGNLALICALMGTPFEIDTRDKILLIEDIDEANYRIDRMLTQLRLAGKLAQAAGIAIGQFTDCQPRDRRKTMPLVNVLDSILTPLGKPVLANLAFGHGPLKATLPLGAEAILDADAKRLVITESAVV